MLGRKSYMLELHESTILFKRNSNGHAKGSSAAAGKFWLGAGSCSSLTMPAYILNKLSFQLKLAILGSLARNGTLHKEEML